MNWYNERPYIQVIPCEDNEELASKGDRLVFRHEKDCSRLVVAPKGEVWYGWVMGIFIDKGYNPIF